jgi:hypothetical protein
MYLQDSNDIQQLFSSEQQPTLWRALPAIEELQTAWEEKRKLVRFVLYRDAIDAGLAKLRKYYLRCDTKPVFILSLGKFPCFSTRHYSIMILVLHPYYKLDYVEMSWGGADEQTIEYEKGNINAKNWKDEACKLVEKMVSDSSWPVRYIMVNFGLDGHILQEAAKS